MTNSFSYILVSENCNESNQLIKVEVRGNLPMDEVKNVHHIIMFDKWHDWFRPNKNEVKMQEEGIELVGDHKFIEYDMKNGEVCTVVFSKLINHDHMDEHISRIIFNKTDGDCDVKRAGFICGESKFGKSESLRIDHLGNKF